MFDERDSFVGRVHEQADLHAALLAVRLVTITGPGGIGKTRLAYRVAGSVAPQLADGARLVELAAIEPGGEIDGLVAAALGLQSEIGLAPRQLLVSALAQRELLLVIDNCEHVLQLLAPLVVEILDLCPGVTILATSRCPLGVPGECVRPLGPMSPADDALELLLARGRAVRPQLTVDAEALSALAAICEQLDGMPLAIELAAVRLRTSTAQEILAHLDRRFRLLRSDSGAIIPGDDRHRTLEAVVDWSYALLQPSEAELFVRLSVFTGGFDLDAAHVVRVADQSGQAGDAVAERIETLDLLDALVRQSLVNVGDEAGRSRYSILETLRQYGAAQCSSELRQCLAAAHASHYHDFARSADDRLAGPEQAHWLARLELEHANIISALAWLLGPDGNAPTGVSLCGVLGWFWRVHSHVASGLAWYERALAVPGVAPVDRTAALIGAGFLDYAAGNPDRGCVRLREAVDLAMAGGTPSQQGWAHHGLARMAVDRRDIPEASFHLEASLTAFNQASDRRGAAYSMFFVGLMHALAGDDQADNYFESAVAVFYEIGDSWGLVGAETGRGRRAYLQGNLAASAERFSEVLARSWELQSRWMGSVALFGLSLVAAKQEKWPLFVKVYRAAADVCDSYGGDVAYNAGAAGPKACRRAEQVLSNFQEQWSTARVDTFAEAVAVGREASSLLCEVESEAFLRPLTGDGSAASLPAGVTSVLTSREVAVLTALTAGRSNREIGAELHLSVRTVENHLHRIYMKLGVSSRVGAVVRVRDGLPPPATQDPAS